MLAPRRSCKPQPKKADANIMEIRYDKGKGKIHQSNAKRDSNQNGRSSNFEVLADEVEGNLPMGESAGLEVLNEKEMKGTGQRREGVLNRKGKRPNVITSTENQLATPRDNPILNQYQPSTYGKGRNGASQEPNMTRKESAITYPNRAASESDHWVVRGSTKSAQRKSHMQARITIFGSA